ncbi:hypothetical protein ACMHYB_48005 [Sorangium sp. So ce1128]
MRSSDVIYYGLSKAAFSKEQEDAELWLPTSKQVLVDDLEARSTSVPACSSWGSPGSGRRVCYEPCDIGCLRPDFA